MGRRPPAAVAVAGASRRGRLVDGSLQAERDEAPEHARHIWLIGKLTAPAARQPAPAAAAPAEARGDKSRRSRRPRAAAPAAGAAAAEPRPPPCAPFGRSGGGGFGGGADDAVESSELAGCSARCGRFRSRRSLPQAELMSDGREGGGCRRRPGPSASSEPFTASDRVRRRRGDAPERKSPWPRPSDRGAARGGGAPRPGRPRRHHGALLSWSSHPRRRNGDGGGRRGSCCLRVGIAASTARRPRSVAPKAAAPAPAAARWSCVHRRAARAPPPEETAAAEPAAGDANGGGGGGGFPGLSLLYELRSAGERARAHRVGGGVAGCAQLQGLHLDARRRRARGGGGEPPPLEGCTPTGGGGGGGAAAAAEAAGAPTAAAWLPCSAAGQAVGDELQTSSIRRASVSSMGRARPHGD